MRKTPMLIEGKEVELEKETNPAESETRKERKEKEEGTESPLSEPYLDLKKDGSRWKVMENYVSSLLKYCQRGRKKVSFDSVKPFIPYLFFGQTMNLEVSEMNLCEYLKFNQDPKLEYLLENTNLSKGLPPIVEVLDPGSINQLPLLVRSVGLEQRRELEKLCQHSNYHFLIPNFNFLSLALPYGDSFRQYAALRQWKLDEPLYITDGRRSRKINFPKTEEFFDLEHLFEFVKKTDTKDVKGLMDGYQALRGGMLRSDFKYEGNLINNTKRMLYACVSKYNSDYVRVQKP